MVLVTCSAQFALTVRRFCCDNRNCQRRTFAENFGPPLLPRARRTTDAGALLLDPAETAGGEAGARLARATGLPVSPGTRLRVTLLRLLRRSVLVTAPTPRVLGVDDLALRRGHLAARPSRYRDRRARPGGGICRGGTARRT